MNHISKNIKVESISSRCNLPVHVDVFRMDEVHPLISGNKWFKLKQYLVEAEQFDKKVIVTFGGPYSNHIIATAAAGKELGIKTAGVIRGEQPATPSHTLKNAELFQMKLFFTSREHYKMKTIPQQLLEMYASDQLYIIPEGGYGQQGMAGIREVYNLYNLQKYDYILCAVGTGTTLAGLIAAAPPNQKLIGISVFKNNFSLEQQVEILLGGHNNNFQIIHDFHFGGYAKYNEELISFMNDYYNKTSIPSDFVYTGKLFFAVDQLIKLKFFPKSSSILILHSGGLQGNDSLRKGTLIFR
ncbi:MAG: 1-aminocyclopropane-1-carboxylate deaminase/D-cysteine desulfhydrase [Candidatus Dadabacteria bacterium]